MPRPDVAMLGIAYRRIPLLAIGRDVYLDTKLQLYKLELLHPDKPGLGADNPGDKAVQHLLSRLMNDAGVFAYASQLIPPNLPLLKDPAFSKDRGELTGRRWDEEAMLKGRPDALIEIVNVFKFLESTLLADGRTWILKTDTPSLADIEAVWPLHWLTGMPGALPKEMFSAAKYPKVYAWIQRFQETVSAMEKKLGKPRKLSGEEAAKLIGNGQFHDADKGVDGADPVVEFQQLKNGDKIMLWPVDTGSAHKEVGTLIGVDQEETVIEVLQSDQTAVRVHAPRHGYRFRKVTEEDEKSRRLQGKL